MPALAVAPGPLRKAAEKRGAVLQKDAAKRGIPYFAAYGAEEVATNAVRVKTLARSEETSLEVEAIPNFVKA